MANEVSFIDSAIQKAKTFHYATGNTISVYDNEMNIIEGFTRDINLLLMNDNEDNYTYFLKQIELPIGQNKCRINVFDAFSFIVCDVCYQNKNEGFVVVGPIIVSDNTTKVFSGTSMNKDEITSVTMNQLEHIEHLADILYWTFSDISSKIQCKKSYSRASFLPYALEQYFADSIDYVKEKTNLDANLDFNDANQIMTQYIIEKDKKSVKKFLNTLIDLSLPSPSSKAETFIEDLRIKKNIMISYFSFINHVVLENIITSDFYIFFSSYIITEFEQANSETELRIIVNELIDKLFDNMLNIPLANSKAIRSAMQYISNNINHKLTLSEVSEHIYLNPKYLSRLFIKETGMSFKQYVVEHKIIRAKNLLRHTNKSLPSIALAIGIDSCTNFSTFFKKHVGMTPKEYRNK